MADTAADERRSLLCHNHLGRDRMRWRRDEILRLLVISQQRFDFPPQDLIVFTGYVQKGGALVRRSLQRGMIELFDLSPLFRLHYGFESSRSNQVLASRQSRATVSGETFKTSAVSSTLRPPKYLNSTDRACLGSIAASAVSASSR